MHGTITLAQDARFDEPLPQTVADEAAALFNANGYLVVENAFDPELLIALREEFMAHYFSKGREELEQSNLRVGDKRLQVTVAVEGLFNNSRLYANPKLTPILSALLEWDYVLNCFGCVVAYPGAKFQGAHRDYHYLYRETNQAANLAPHALTLFVPLIDLDERTGTTLIAQSSHREHWIDPENMWDDALLRAPFTKLGSCYFVDYRVLHCGAPNTSDEPRPVLYLTYSRPWFRDTSNYKIQEPLEIDRENYLQVPEACRQMFALAPAARPPRT